ncbi:MAG: hypothetical protein JXR21_04545 [Candidatus Marinimicrobia bacterium]|nr:hypothetical protein [Candidatus Neomarinimicrobiota bacterium]
MDKNKKIAVLLILAFLFPAGAQDDPNEGVYFKPGTLHLPEISQFLEEHHYRLSTDSLAAAYRGEVFYYLEEKDSVRCEIRLTQPSAPPFVLGSFMTEPVRRENVRSSLREFTIWLLILNAISTILFFVRTP